MWINPVITTTSANQVTCSRCIIMTPDRLTCATVVELRYLGKMSELDHDKFVATYMAILFMELKLMGANVVGGIKHTSEL